MRRLSLAAGLRLALIGLTLTMIVVAVFGVSGLYGARAEYEAELNRAYALEATAARLRAASVVEQAAVLARDGRGARREAQRAFTLEADRAAALAAGDPVSEELVRQLRAQEARLRELDVPRGAAAARLTRGLRPAAVEDLQELTGALTQRQGDRRLAARTVARESTQTAALTVIVASLLALLAAMVLVRETIRRLRRPLDELVDATGRLAKGDLPGGVSTTGPREFQTLTDAFNNMADDLRVARTRLERERQKLAVTIESLGDGLLVCDDQGVVTTLNPRASQLLPGVAVGEPVKANGASLPPLEEATGGEAIADVQGRTLAVTAAPLEEGSGGTVWTIRDASERMRLERAKSDFVATASHELRSPLTSIKGFAELLDRSRGELRPKHREAVEVIRLSTERLVDLVEDLLEVTRIEGGSVAVDLRPTEVGQVIEEAADLITPRLAQREQTLIRNVPPGLPAALADPGRLREVIENLLTNAHLYTEDGGRIEVSSSSTSAEVAVTVSDTGPGLAAEELEHVFDRFYRGRNASVPGTGLGLWIVKSLTELQGGSVEVSSEVGAGSAFTVRLPRPSAAADGDLPGGQAGLPDAAATGPGIARRTARV